MNSEEIIQRKKKLLADVLEYYVKNNDFPEKKKFRVTRVRDWALLDELVRQRFFFESYGDDRDKYVLTLKGIGLIENDISKKIIKTGNLLIPTFQKFYQQDQSDNKYWDVVEISADSNVPEEDIVKYLFFLEGMYVYFRSRYPDTTNRYLTTKIGINERILTATSVEDFIRDYLEEKEDLYPSFIKYEGVKSKVFDYGEDRLVAFLDVLGFRKLISDEDKIAKYFDLVTQFLSNLKGLEKKSEIKYALISDSVVLSFPFGGSLVNLNEFLTTLGRLQADLCLEDIWLRGAVTIGKIKMQYEDRHQIVYGQALIDAYVLETNYAKFPRIVIDPRIFKIIGIDRKNLNSELNNLNSNSKYFRRVVFDPGSGAGLYNKDVLPQGINIPNDGMWINFAEYIHVEEDRFSKYVGVLRKNLYDAQEHFDKYKWVQTYTMLDYSSKNDLSIYHGNMGKLYRELESL